MYCAGRAKLKAGTPGIIEKLVYPWCATSFQFCTNSAYINFICCKFQIFKNNGTSTALWVCVFYSFITLQVSDPKPVSRGVILVAFALGGTWLHCPD